MAARQRQAQEIAHVLQLLSEISINLHGAMRVDLVVHPNLKESPVVTLDHYPILRAAAQNEASFDSALQAIARGAAAGEIRRAVWNDAKLTLSRVADDGWERHVVDPFFYGGNWAALPQAVQDLNDRILILSLHDVLAAGRKIGKCNAQGPAMDAMRSYAAEVVPLADVVASLKGKLVKGRAPSVGPAVPANPDKLVGTCPVCFRWVAVVRDKMAHHGNERPGVGWQTASFPGIRFKPLEVSSEGLVWLVGSLRERLESSETAHRGRASKASLSVRLAGPSDAFEAITNESPLWPQHYRDFVNGLESEITSLRRELLILKKKLTEWKPQVLA